jgi:hypothetical protein
MSRGIKPADIVAGIRSLLLVIELAMRRGVDVLDMVQAIDQMQPKRNESAQQADK